MSATTKHLGKPTVLRSLDYVLKRKPASIAKPVKPAAKLKAVWPSRTLTAELTIPAHYTEKQAQRLARDAQRALNRLTTNASGLRAAVVEILHGHDYFAVVTDDTTTDGMYLPRQSFVMP